jgi:hypothetical protein
MDNTITKAREFVERMRPSAGCDNKHCGDSSPCHACAGCRLDTALDLIEALTPAPMSEDEALERARLREALQFYATEWEQDVDAERTISGWEGSIGDVSPSEALCRDRGEKARLALQAHEPLPVKAGEDEDAEWLRDVIATYDFADQRDRLEAIAARLEEKRHG